MRAHDDPARGKPRSDSRFVEFGRQLAARTDQYGEAVAKIEAEVEAAYRSRIDGASGPRRLVLRVQRWRECRRRVRELLPDEALFLTGRDR